MHDLVIRGCTVYDGTGSIPFTSDIAIDGDRISRIAQGLKGQSTLDANGLTASPGFIDVHGHSEFTLLADPRAEGKLQQGITTEIIGNCGLSAAPLLGACAERRLPDLSDYGIESNWESLRGYVKILEGLPLEINVATLVGHGNIRASVMGYVDRDPTTNEMEQMRVLLREAIEDGALGLSTGLIYPPGAYSKAGEIESLAKAGVEMAGEKFIYTSHMRSEGDDLLNSIKETLRVGEVSGAKVHVSHLKTWGRDNWHKAQKCVELLEDAQSRGIRTTCDRYPYTASSTDLDALLPAWVYEGGTESELKRLGSLEVRERLQEESPVTEDDARSVVISSVGSATGEWMLGKSLYEIAQVLKKEMMPALFHLLLKEKLRVGAIFHVMSQENLERFLALPYCMIGSDSSARGFDGPTNIGKPHPRGFGSFPRFINQWQGSLEEALRKITKLPAETFGLKDRGHLAEGAYADICVFDPEAFRDTATFDEPYKRPVGMRHVIVNGQVALSDGKMLDTGGGRFIRGE